MNAKEEYKVRLEMSKMHEEFIERMSNSYDNNYYVESVWYCYAIFEQRISRLISKYIDKCPLPDCTDDKSAAISTRITCLEKLIKAKYGSFDSFNSNLLIQIKQWCCDRNELVHGLISLKHYKQYDEEFKELAKRGVPLVFELYDACTDFRNKWYLSDNPINEFPNKNCKCNKRKCINPSCI